MLTMLTYSAWRPWMALARAAPGFFLLPARIHAVPADSHIEARLQKVLADAREAGSEAGLCDAPDHFIDGIDPCLCAIVRPTPDAFEVDPEVLMGEAGGLRQQEADLDAELRRFADERPRLTAVPWLVLPVGTLAAGSAAWLLFDMAPLVAATLAAGATATGALLVHALTVWVAGRPRRCHARTLRRVRRELEAIDAVMRAAARTRAQREAWLTQSRALIEAEYRRHRARAASAVDSVCPRTTVERGSRRVSRTDDRQLGVAQAAC